MLVLEKFAQVIIFLWLGSQNLKLCLRLKEVLRITPEQFFHKFIWPLFCLNSRPEDGKDMVCEALKITGFSFTKFFCSLPFFPDLIQVHELLWFPDYLYFKFVIFWEK